MRAAQHDTYGERRRDVVNDAPARVRTRSGPPSTTSAGPATARRDLLSSARHFSGTGTARATSVRARRNDTLMARRSDTRRARRHDTHLPDTRRRRHELPCRTARSRRRSQHPAARARESPLAASATFPTGNSNQQRHRGGGGNASERRPAPTDDRGGGGDILVVDTSGDVVTEIAGAGPHVQTRSPR